MKHLEQIKHFFGSSAPCLLVVGQTGSGKSSLLRDAIAQSAGHPLPILYIPGRSSVKLAGLFGQISQAWSLPSIQQDTTAEQQLSELLCWLQGHEQKGILVIDDAHLLPYSLLSALVKTLQQQSFGSCHFQCVLAGKPSLVEKVQVLCSPPCDVVRLGLMTTQQVQSRVSDYLASMGVSAKPSHVREVADRLYRQSHGELNRLEQSLQSLTLQDFMQHKSAKTQPTPSADVQVFNWRVFMRQHAARFVALIGLCLTMIVMYWQEQNPFTSQPRLPSKPYHFAMTKTKSVVSPKTTSPATPAQPDYTVQLMGSFKRADIAQFVQSHHLASNTHIYQATYHHKPWYVLGFGAYATRADADSARDHLPANLPHGGAWVRSIH